MKRRELKLDIERVGDRYRARVRKAPAGKGSWTWFEPPDEEEIRLAIAKDLGRRLFESVFAGSVLTAWRASLAASRDELLLRLRLDGDPRLLKVPWEILFDPDRRTFVAIERRLIRSLDLPVKARPLEAPAPLRILVVLSSPPDAAPLDLDREWAVLDEVLGDKVELHFVPPRLEEVDRALRSGEWHALHFVGHGGTDGEGGFLILEDRHGESRTVDHLRLKTFLGHPTLRLVVLNACEGARPGTSDAFSGVAQALVKSGVPAVVAMQQAILDAAAITFAKSFYGALAEQQTLGTALWRAREVLFRDHETDWAVPVLYLNGRDAPLLVANTRKEEFSKRKVAALVVGVLLLTVLIWVSVRSPEPPAVPEGLIVPRGAEENPKECPSPEGLNMAFVRIAPGSFLMGQSGGAKEDEPVHLVKITRPFCIGVYEVTQEQWDLVFKNPPPPPEERYLPALDIKYDAAQDFIHWLNQNDPALPYRLATEAEWEYVARGKTQMVYSFGDDAANLVRHANCGESGDGFDGPTWVGQFPENSWEVHDMLGNAFEWVADWHGPYPSERVDDPVGPQKGEKRIRRGGSWASSAKACSPAARSIVQPTRSDKYTGFRIVREIR